MADDGTPRPDCPHPPQATDPLPPSLAQELQHRYRLERELGRGGMATVYLAHDLKHDRPVALKVLHPDLAAALGPERFQREIHFAARLQHPHILSVHDSGETAGQLWFTMPFVEGESLRDRLRREAQLPVEDAVRIASETARALDYAHRHGVVHRDIKPENILITADGDTLVADFGIARALSGGADEERSGRAETLTETGTSIGTPTYMSPEQASGDKHVDARSDIYSLAVVLYEMLAGEPPFTGPTAQAIIAKRFSGEIPRVRQARPSVPPAIEQAIGRALAPVPADRFATAADFAKALAGHAQAGPPPAADTTAAAPAATRRALPLAAITLALGFMVGLGVLFAWRSSQPGGESTGRKVLAVLPFENLGDSADAYFADGVANEIRTKLAGLPGLEVIARGSSAEYRNTSKRPDQIARELGADFLLTATVQWAREPGGPSRVRVSPELVDVTPGHKPSTRWGERFDASLTDVFGVQADIAAKVASALDVALADSARSTLVANPTENLAAYDAFLKGEAASLAMRTIDQPSLRRAVEFYERAVALDSSFVAAWAQLARAYATTYYYHSAQIPGLARKAHHAAERTRALAPNRPEGPLALGTYFRLVERDARKALVAFEQGLQSAPNSVDLLDAAAEAEQAAGRWEAALGHAKRAAALDPRSAGAARRVAATLINMRRFSEAHAAVDRALMLAPTSLDAIREQALLAVAEGDLDGARAAIDAGLRVAEPAALVAFFALYEDLYWVLDDSQQRLLLTLPPSAFADDRALWAIIRAQTYALRGNLRESRSWADSARLTFEDQLRATPDDPQRLVFRGIALAYLGRKAEALSAGRRAVILVPISDDAFLGPYIQHQFVRICVIVGEHEAALDHLEPLLEIPYPLSAGRLRVDPNFVRLRGNPRFERLIAQK